MNSGDMIRLAAMAAVLGAGMPFAHAETVAELALNENTTVTVESGETKRIEYVSGAADVELTKEGNGTLEIAIVGNTNATFRVNGGKLKFVRPGKLGLAFNEATFHVDGSDPDSMDVEVLNGTNFVTKIKDADGRSTYAVKLSSYKNPYLTEGFLNGLTVFDFGTMYGAGLTGHGAAMEWSEHHFPNELFYVWADREGVKDIANPRTYGPTPVNLWYSGYRGSNVAVGVSWKLFRTSTRIAANLFLDDVKANNETCPDDGWHLLRTYTEKFWDPYTATDTDKENYRVRGFGYKPGGTTPTGGFRLAEMLLCTNRLTEAKRQYVNYYLKRKWFGGYPVKSVLLAEGTTLDISDAPATVGFLQLFDSAAIVGETNLRILESSGVSSNLLVSAVYNAPKEGVIPNLGFGNGGGEVSVAKGSVLLNAAEGVGTFSKSGNGTLAMARLGDGFDSIEVKGGALELNPLKTPASSLHIDASDDSAFEIEVENGTNFVNRWQDVQRNGQGLVKTKEKYPFDKTRTINRPFRVANQQNGMPMVDFGTIADAERSDGWGAMMDISKILRRSGSAPYLDNPTSQQGVYQVFTVWEDYSDLIDAPLFEYNGETKPFIGPVLFGDGYSWYRGAGGNGTGFPFCSMAGPSTIRENMYLDGERLYSQYVRFTPIGKGLHMMDQKIGWSDTEATGLRFVGGNLDAFTTNGPYAAKGVFGGARFAEVMAFRYYLPDAQRAQIRNALGVKWFGTDNYSLEYAFDNIDVSPGAGLSFPYADVTVTNLAIAGDILARTVSIEKSLNVNGDSTVSAPLAMKSGGTISLSRDEDGFSELEVDSINLGSRGIISISDWEGIVCGQSFRVIKSSSVSGVPSGWKARRSDGVLKASFESKSDGLYLNIISGGTRILVR